MAERFGSQRLMRDQVMSVQFGYTVGVSKMVKKREGGLPSTCRIKRGPPGVGFAIKERPMLRKSKEKNKGHELM